MLLRHDPVYILHHHDGIVHHYTDGKDKSEQSHHVQGKPEDEHHTESTDQRYRYRYGRYQGRPPALEREEHHQYHKDESFEKGLVHMMDGLGDIGSHIERYVVRYSLGKTCADFLQSGLYIPGHFHGIRPGKHIEVHHRGVLPVDAALRIVRLGLKGYPRHILEPDYRSVVARPQDNVLELAHRRKTSRSSNRDRNVHTVDRLLPQHSCRRLTVLVLERLLKILYSQPERSELVRLHPYLHRIITAADIGDPPDTRYTTEHVQNIEGSEIAQIYLVELLVFGLDRHRHETARSLFLHRYAILDHLCGKSCLRLLHTVLYLHRRDVGIGRDVKSKGGRETSRIGIGGLHIKHSRSSVQFLLDRSCHSLGHGSRARSRI